MPRPYKPLPIDGSVAADVAQLVERLICNQGVAGSSPVISSTRGRRGKRNLAKVTEGYPSGQREQTVNLPAVPT